MDAVPIGSIIGKVWGTTQRVFLSDTVQVEVIRPAAGYQCSLHHHAGRHNLFHVVAGRIRVRTYKNGLWDVTELGPGQSTVVGPGDKHRFEAVEGSVVLEIYYAVIDPGDIVRVDQGGPTPPAPESTPFVSGPVRQE